MTTAAWILAAIFVLMLALVISLFTDRREKAPVLSAAARDLQDETEEYALPQDMREDEPVNKFGLDENDEIELTGLLPHLLGEYEDSKADDPQFEVPEQEEEEEPFFDLSDFEPEDPDIQKETDALKKDVSVIWPQSDVMMKQTQIASGVLYEWQGLSGNDDCFLFDLCSPAARAAMIDVSSRISDANAVPKENFAFLLHPDVQRAHADSQTASLFLRSEERKPAFVITEDNEADLFEIAGMKLVRVSVGSCAKALLRPSVKDANKLAAEAGKQLKPARNITSMALMDILSFGIRMKNHLPVGRNAAVAALIEKYPDLEKYLCTRIAYDEETGIITVTASDDQALDEILGVLHQKDSDLRLISQRSASVCTDTESVAFGKVEDALISLYGADDILPVVTDRPSSWSGIPSAGICFRDRQASSRLISSILL